jgi:hypothetical protein
MPPIELDIATIAAFGSRWLANRGALKRTSPQSSGDLGRVIDKSVAAALAPMLGRPPIVEETSDRLVPTLPDCVEFGSIRVIGGVRPQNFDVGYRPDGVRFAFDSKTLNDKKSVSKNWQNMVNDLATEATTVHSRFPYAVVAFIVMIPSPCLTGGTRLALIETLERLGRRSGVGDAHHMAEAISLIAWDPITGSIDATTPLPTSNLRYERFSQFVEAAYRPRYQGLPPHTDAVSANRPKRTGAKPSSAVGGH